MFLLAAQNKRKQPLKDNSKRLGISETQHGTKVEPKSSGRRNMSF